MKLTEPQRKVLQVMADYIHGCAVFGNPSRNFKCGYSIQLKLPIVRTSLSMTFMLRSGWIEKVEGQNHVYRITQEGRRMLEA